MRTGGNHRRLPLTDTTMTMLGVARCRATVVERRVRGLQPDVREPMSAKSCGGMMAMKNLVKNTVGRPPMPLAVAGMALATLPAVSGLLAAGADPVLKNRRPPRALSGGGGHCEDSIFAPKQ